MDSHLRQIRTNLTQLLSRISETSLSTTELVAVGWELWRILDVSNKHIEEIKHALRALAETEGHAGTFPFRGDHETSCTVTVPKPKFQLRKDADVEALRLVLKDKFNELFLTLSQVQMRSDFEARISDLLPEERDTVLQSMNFQTSTSRVSFERSS